MVCTAVVGRIDSRIVAIWVFAGEIEQVDASENREEAAKEGDGVNRVGCIEAAEEDERGDECEGREGYVVKRVDAARNVRMWM